jgi:AcrR family transcriptional regulator
MPKRPVRNALPRPRKRPSQARSRFTVASLYEAFVRIWRRDGPSAATMRAVAAEAGYAVGTLYEYFPNREALLSGYFRHCLEDLCRRLREADMQASAQPGSDGSWQARLARMVSVTFDEARQAPYFDADMLLSESTIADGLQQRKAFALLAGTWHALLSSWPDLPAVDRAVIDTLVTTLWGGRRYAILLGRRRANAQEVQRVTAMATALLQGRPS